MKTFPRSSFVVAVSLVSIGLVWAQESSPLILPATAPSAQYQSLIDFDPNSATPFMVNPIAAKDLSAADNEIAMKQLLKIKEDIADLVTRHPSSPAAKEIGEILEKAGLKVIKGYGIYSKDVYCITVPITR